MAGLIDIFIAAERTYEISELDVSSLCFTKYKSIFWEVGIMKRLPVLCFFILLFFLIDISASENQWEKVEEDNDITVFTRSVEGFGVKQFKGVTFIDAPMEVLYEVLKDSEGFKEWFGDCLRQETTVHIDGYSKYFLHIVKVPVLKDRNLVGKVVFDIDQTNGILKAQITAQKKEMIPEEFQQSAWVPESSKFVRITDLYCNINVYQESTLKSKVVYEVLVDPAGWIPAWVANYFAVKNPETTLTNLKQMTKKQKYWESANRINAGGPASSKN